jgi:putative magnesium chelatase accessory protein
MTAGLDWDKDATDWPNRAASRFVDAGGMHWHVQRMGRGAAVLLVHGSGASTHSWRAFLPSLAARFDVVAPDLPGHGFTTLPDPEGLSLPGMAASLATLLDKMQFRPVIAIGHSAGAAVLARMCLDGAIRPRALVSLNGSLLPLGGMQSPLAPPLGRWIAGAKLLPQSIAGLARWPGSIERMLRDTGSNLEPRDIALYRRLAESPRHVAGALGMMAMWDPRPLARELPLLRVPLWLIAGSNDRFIPPRMAHDAAALVPGAKVIELRGLGHLAHEERPDEVLRALDPVCLQAATALS